MRANPWTDGHDRMVADVTPSTDEPTDADVTRAWNQVADAIRSDVGAPGRSRSRMRAGIAAGIGAVVLGTSGLAAASLYSAHTGKGPIDAEDLRLGGPGEKLQMSAPDYGAVIAEETDDIPFPDAAARAAALQDQVDDARRAGTDEFVSTGAVRAWVADAALCSWSNQWAAATRSGDESARTQAIDMIQAAPGWPAVTAIDPSPSSRMKSQQVQDSQGNVTTEHYRDDSQFFYLAALGDAVEGRTPSAVAGILAANNGYCRPELVPDLPNANPMRAER